MFCLSDPASVLLFYNVSDLHLWYKYTSVDVYILLSLELITDLCTIHFFPLLRLSVSTCSGVPLLDSSGRFAKPGYIQPVVMVMFPWTLFSVVASVWWSAVSIRTYPRSDWLRGPVPASYWPAWPGLRWWGADGRLCFWLLQSQRRRQERCAPECHLLDWVRLWPAHEPEPSLLNPERERQSEI